MSLRSCAGRLDVPPKEDESPRLQFSEEAGGLGVELGTRNADEQELTRIARWHKCVNTQPRC